MLNRITEHKSSLQYVVVRHGKLFRNGTQLAEYSSQDLAELYHTLGFSYLKFFKMDSLCKLAWIAAESLLMEDPAAALYAELDKSRVAIVLASTDGCLDVDKRYRDTIEDIPSPALFVYTLPNIMLGEISIRHGFKGEQLCFLTEDSDWDELLFQVNDLLHNRGMTHCLFGKVDASGANQAAAVFWVDAESIGALSEEGIRTKLDALPTRQSNN